MKRHALVPLPIVLALLVAAPAVGQELRYGPESPLGHGTARAYVIVGDGQPVEIGIALSESALEGLPDLADKPDEEAFVLVDLPLPEENPTPFRLASMDWNPRGHPPVMYGLPHFDFHFYLIDAEVRDAILPGDPPDLALFEGRGSRAPEEGLLPMHYVYPGEATVPQMGGHWVDPASHEFHGSTFDTTFIYGTWDGGVIFWEPMMTKAYIESRPDATIEIATPTRAAATGWYPSAYRVGFDPQAKEYRIALVGFARM
ncbi:MAG: DUF5602 domain-containing protein [Gemmatimonadota bacterium]